MELSEPKAKQEIGLAGTNTRHGNIRDDEFLVELRGRRAIRAFREMRDNDATVGAVMYAIEQTLRDVKIQAQPANDTEEAKREAEFLDQVLSDMDHTLDDHISEAISSLTYGFSVFEVVYKRRVGPYEKNPKKRSRFTDGRLGIRKLATRAPWTIDRFVPDEGMTGNFIGVKQDLSLSGSSGFMPMDKVLHYKTTTINGDPSGRSILRNAYTAYKYLKSAQSIEIIGIERELCGLPVVKIPSDYLRSDATDDQKALKDLAMNIAADIKRNEQSGMVIPSDTYMDADGKPSNIPLVEVGLLSSSGTRAIDISAVISRYQHDIARSIMAEFLMLGSSSTGSYALSKSKTDIFLRALESYIQSIVDVLNKQLVERLWEINGLDFDLMPTLKAGDVAPHDLKELGSFLRNLNGADINLTEQLDTIEALMINAELPFDRDGYKSTIEDKKRIAEEDRQIANQVNQQETAPNGNLQ
jgi:hypothetical protein